MDEKDIKNKMDKCLTAFIDNIKVIRSSRIDTSIVAGINIDVYGAKMRLNQLAVISTPDQRTILVEVWDRTVQDDVIKGILAANMGFNPVKEEGHIRIRVPELSKERREELIKLVAKYEEDAKIALRMVRQNYMDEIKADSTISNEERNSIQTNVDKIIKDYNERLFVLSASKKEEISRV